MVRVILKYEVAEAVGSEAWRQRHAELATKWHSLWGEGKLPCSPSWNHDRLEYRVEIDGDLLDPLAPFDISKIPPEIVARVTLRESRANFFRRDGLYEIRECDVESTGSGGVCKVYAVSKERNGCLIQLVSMDAPTVKLLRAAYRVFFEGVHMAVVRPDSDWTKNAYVVTHRGVTTE
ncbi:MAG: hypothetical protein V1723_02540 [Candidatus Uhrbacteria bacterium]